MEELYNKGLTKAIGVSNYSIEQIERVMKIAKVPIHNCQVDSFFSLLFLRYRSRNYVLKVVKVMVTNRTVADLLRAE